ncbi:hypothetical protein AAC387_Pa09g0734 [Persea americana]
MEVDAEAKLPDRARSGESLLMVGLTSVQGYSMGTYLHIQVHIYLMLIIYSIIPLVANSSYADIPAYSNKESRKQNIFGCWPCSRKHVLKYYYDQRDILLESDSQGVLEQEVPSLDSCNGLSHNLISIPRLSGLQRHLIGEGSHRRLHSSMRFDFPSDADSILSLSSCEAVIIERLPLGVFADPFELQHLVQRGVFVDAAVFGDTNLELPSALSNLSAVEIHLGIHDLITSHHKGVEISLELPLHARYPPLDGSGGYSRVDMGLPDVLMRCMLGKERGKHCLWVSIAHEGFVPGEVPIWQIPCGSSAHSGFVSTVTFASAFVSVLLIVLAARSYSTSTLE